MTINYTSIWFPESLLSTWLGASIITLTTSLLFYHMTRVKSLEMNSRIAGVFAVALILMSIGIAIVSIFPYYQRVGYILEDEKDKNDPEKMRRSNLENEYRILYTTLCSIIIFIEVGIAVAIFQGTFFSNIKK